MTENTYEPGCYGDGSFGPDHCTYIVFKLAESDGWTPELDEEEKRVYDHFFDAVNSNPISDNAYLTEDEMPIIESLEDEAIDYLNEHCSDDSHCWGYDQGDFGYWECEEE